MGELSQTQIVTHHLRRSRIVAFGTVVVLTCLLCAGFIEVYLRLCLRIDNSSPPSTVNTGVSVSTVDAGVAVDLDGDVDGYRDRDVVSPRTTTTTTTTATQTTSDSDDPLQSEQHGNVDISIKSNEHTVEPVDSIVKHFRKLDVFADSTAISEASARLLSILVRARELYGTVGLYSGLQDMIARLEKKIDRATLQMLNGLVAQWNHIIDAAVTEDASVIALIQSADYEEIDKQNKAIDIRTFLPFHAWLRSGDVILPRISGSGNGLSVFELAPLRRTSLGPNVTKDTARFLSDDSLRRLAEQIRVELIIPIQQCIRHLDTSATFRTDPYRGFNQEASAVDILAYTVAFYNRLVLHLTPEEIKVLFSRGRS